MDECRLSCGDIVHPQFRKIEIFPAYDEVISNTRCQVILLFKDVVPFYVPLIEYNFFFLMILNLQTFSR